MDSYLGLKLKLSLKDGSVAEGTVKSIDSKTQKLSLTEVQLKPKGSKRAVVFPDLTVLSTNIEDIEIVNSTGVAASTDSNRSTGAAGKAANKANVSGGKSFVAPSSLKAALPSPTKPASFQTGAVPCEDFDFQANLARFDKASEFQKIQATDSVSREDRLVAINSPQRKLGIKESVLDKKGGEGEANEKEEGARKQTAQVARLPLPLRPAQSAPKADSTKSNASLVLIEDGSSEDEDESRIELFGLPIMAETTDSVPSVEDSERSCTIAAVNFAHHLLAELSSTGQGKYIVALLSLNQSTALILETLEVLSKHGRAANLEILAIFAVGGAGRRIEIPSNIKSIKKRLGGAGRIKFLQALGDVISVPPSRVSVILDGLKMTGNTAETLGLSSEAQDALINWMVSVASANNKTSIYGVGASLLAQNQNRLPPSNLRSSVSLVVTGLPTEQIISSLKVSHSLLLLDDGVEREGRILGRIGETITSADFFADSFVTELEYD